MNRSISLVLGLGFLAVVGCDRARRSDRDQGLPPATGSAGASAATPTAPTPTPTPTPSNPAADGSVGGTVVETMDAGGYTYAKLDRGTGAVWVAGPETKLTVGTVIGSVQGTAMPGFHSDTLSRTFDQIYFIPSFPITGTAPPNPHGTAGAADPAIAPSGPAPSGTPPVVAAPMDKLAPPDGGVSIADLYAGKAALAGKPVIVRGKVVKVNDGIMGRNWIHLQDGTGAAGTNDLTVTFATGTVAIGDVVVARGTVAIDQDFGAGYAYAVLVENATVGAQ